MNALSPVGTGGNKLPATHCSLSFLTSLTIVYCRIKKLSTYGQKF
jgi:hypothetical protein